MIEIIAIMVSTISLGLSVYAVYKTKVIIPAANKIVATVAGANICSKCGRKVVRYEPAKDGSIICANCPK